MAETIQDQDPAATAKKTQPDRSRTGGVPPPGSHVPFSSCQLEDQFTWRRIVGSFGGHLLLLGVMASVPIVYTTNLDLPSPRVRVDFIVEQPPEEPEITTARPQPPPPRPRPEPVTRAAALEEELVVPLPPEPPPPEDRRVAPEPEPEPEPEIVVAARPARPDPPVRKVVSAEFDRPAPVPELAERRPAPVRTDIFSEGSSATPTTTLPAREVQTGGFGSPDGVVATKTTRRPGAPEKLGAFDLPEGPGQGNGRGGATGARGTVASAGFGSGVATDGGARGRGSAGRGSVRSGGFSDAAKPVEPSARPRPRPVEPALVPIEIVSKPRPVYSAEARRLHLEGEVVLEVRFERNGLPRVLRVVKGLGYGLDEAAMRAAEQIQFKPARRDGQAVDYTANVRMVFQLA